MEETTTWEGIVERDMDARTIERMYCLAKNKKEAEKELKRLAKQEHPDAYWIKITDIKISE